MDFAKVVPWTLAVVLAGICWQQQLEISDQEKETSGLQQEVNRLESEMKSQKSVVKTEEIKTIQAKSTKSLQKQHAKRVMSISNPEIPISKDDMEEMIEDRARERMEELEEEKRQARVEQMTDHMQNLVDEWTAQFDWSKDTQNAVMDILTDYVHGRVEVHVLLKNKSLEREGIRPYFQQLAKERNEAIVELVGEEQFPEMEDDLDPRRGKK